MLSPRHCGELFVKAQRLSKKDGEVCELANQLLQLLEEVEEDVKRSAKQEDRESWLASYQLSIFISSIDEAMSMEGIVELLQESVRNGRIRRLLHGEPIAEEIHADEKRRGLAFLNGSDVYVPADFGDNGACAIILKARQRAGALKRGNSREK